MNEHSQSLETLQDIKKMMERSSRFISLSGLSGISAGICALTGGWAAYPYVFGHKENSIYARAFANDYTVIFNSWLFWIAAATFSAALISAFFFTYLKSKKEGIPIWGATARRLLFSVCIPLLAGAIYLFKLLQAGNAGFIAPGCLLFYGLALISGSRYTLGEIKYLGYCELLLGTINLWFIGYGLFFWVAGFGLLHIAYGVYMWNKYERIAD